MRALLTSYPRNELGWLELARLQCLSGNPANGRRAIETALALNNDHRGVVRGASRFFLHVDEPERALQVVRRAPSLRSDPWLAAAEISIASAIGVPPGGMRRGRELAESGAFASFHTSELNAALATEFLKHGTDRLARKFFRRSLADPTDNTLAQNAWAEQRLPDLVKADRLLTGEAALRHAVLTSDFEGAAELCWVWLRDEPYSSAPAINGSFFALNFMNDHELALRFVKRGLLSAPNNFTLLNNGAATSAFSGNVESARAYLAKMERPKEATGLALYYATSGLIEFRSGHTDRGRELYLRALDLCLRERQPIMAFRAMAYLMVEEAHAGELSQLDARVFVPLIDQFLAKKKDTIPRLFADVWYRQRAEIIANSNANEDHPNPWRGDMLAELVAQ
jgi:Tfp pilus assembly protein PilF